MARIFFFIILLCTTVIHCKSVKLTYFPVAARGELSRLLAVAGGLALEDSTDTANYATETPFGFLPMLDDSEAGVMQLQESLAIERYIAAVAPNYRGLTPAQRAVDDEFACAKEDLMALETCATNVSAARACVPPRMDRYLGILEKLVPSSDFVHGLGYPTGADLATLVIAKAGFPWGRAMRLADYTDTWPRRFPKVAALAERTAAAPAVAAYLRRSSTFYAKIEPTNGLMIDPPVESARQFIASGSVPADVEASSSTSRGRAHEVAVLTVLAAAAAIAVGATRAAVCWRGRELGRKAHEGALEGSYSAFASAAA